MKFRTCFQSILTVLIFFSLVFGGGLLFGFYKNGRDDDYSFAEYKNKDWAYLNVSIPVEQRVDDLLSRMTLQEKIGQLALVEKNSILKLSDITTYGIGGVLSGGGGKPKPNTPQAWLTMVNTFQNAARNSRLAIPLIYGVDAIHGNANVPGATIFPHNIGLGATHDADVIRCIGEITATEMAETGIYWNFSPNLDVPQDTRWGRIYETFGSDSTVVSTLGTAYLEGLQSGDSHVIGTIKHYIGTGTMGWETSSNPDFSLDQGVTVVDEATLRAIHLPPFAAAIRAGAMSVMVGHIRWNDVELVASHYWLTDVLKKELNFQGFVVSDWGGIDEISGSAYNNVVTAVNAGIDMIMLPYDYQSFIQNIQNAVISGDIKQERLDDAVRRILRAKFSAQLFDTIPSNSNDIKTLGSAEHKLVAREAVRKSLVLLQDTAHVIPLSKTTPHIVIAGSAADNIGRQSGGWTVEWQDIDGNELPGTTVLNALREAVSKETVIEYSLNGYFSNTRADIGIAVVGESPYAEGWGDNAHPSLTTEDLETIARVKSASKKLLVIIISGRPLDISSSLLSWDAVLAAWLPGTEASGITDVLFGDYPLTGTLPIAWP